ncbi:MAG: hypothetical protein ACFB12_08040 [Leptolyngbyaceae cyanobacterium]
MTIQLAEYAEKTGLFSEQEIEKVKLLAFFYQKIQKKTDFTLDEICISFSEIGLHIPNKSRLKQNISKSRSFVKGTTKKSYKLHVSEIQNIEKIHPFVHQKSEEVEATDTVLPSSLYSHTRGYIESLSKQINASYENNIFDGCAVLMRRLLEICLIHSYENLEISDDIKDGQGNYKMLSDVVANALGNSKLSLLRNTKSCLDNFRTIGNFSAHKIYYTARRSDLQKVVLDYRAAIEELFYKSGFKR